HPITPTISSPRHPPLPSHTHTPFRFHPSRRWCQQEKSERETAGERNGGGLPRDARRAGTKCSPPLGFVRPRRKRISCHRAGLAVVAPRELKQLGRRRGQRGGGDPGRAIAAPPLPPTDTAADLTGLPSLQRGAAIAVASSSSLSGRVAVQLPRQLQAGERTMRAVLALLALIGSLLLFLCLARLPAGGAGGASSWDMEGRAATDYTPRVMRYLRSPTNVHLVAPVAPN
ncbi:hypothetical protein E2320_001729, partial [Naja naja]